MPVDASNGLWRVRGRFNWFTLRDFPKRRETKYLYAASINWCAPFNSKHIERERGGGGAKLSEVTLGGVSSFFLTTKGALCLAAEVRFNSGDGGTFPRD